MAVREKMIEQLEWADQNMRHSGVCDAWFQGCDAEMLAVSGKCNGPLFAMLLEASAYEDDKCVESSEKVSLHDICPKSVAAQFSRACRRRDDW